MAFVFAWDDWNSEHVTKHGSNATSAQYVVEHAEDPFPREIGDGKFLVWGRTAASDYLEVIFVFKIPEELEFAALQLLDWAALIDYPGTIAIYICHAMPMKAKQLRQFRKLRKQP